MSTLIDHQGVVFEVVIDLFERGRNKMAEGIRRRAKGKKSHHHIFGFPLTLRLEPFASLQTAIIRSTVKSMSRLLGHGLFAHANKLKDAMVLEEFQDGLYAFIRPFHGHKMGCIFEPVESGARYQSFKPSNRRL